MKAQETLMYLQAIATSTIKAWIGEDDEEQFVGEARDFLIESVPDSALMLLDVEGLEFEHRILSPAYTALARELEAYFVNAIEIIECQQVATNWRDDLMLRIFPTVLRQLVDWRQVAHPLILQALREIQEREVAA